MTPSHAPILRLGLLAPCLAALAMLAALTVPHTAGAGTEEWSTLDPQAQEEDDESVLDHFLTRPPRDWEGEWEHARQGFRTAQGCLTSGEWSIYSDLKTRAALGRASEFRLILRQAETDYQSFDFTDLQFRFTTRWGTPGVWFRPLFDKSRQDFALTWDFGADTTVQQLELAFASEDMFNNLWAFRQTRVGNAAKSEPYEKHPFEPGARWVIRQPAWRAEISGRYLTPSRKRVIDFSQPASISRTSLWGTLGDATFDLRALGLEWGLHAWNQQASSTNAPSDRLAGDNRDFRRAWSVEASARRALSPRTTTEVHCLYEGRDRRIGPPFGPSAFGAVDRVLNAEFTYRVLPHVSTRVGGLYDQISIAQAGPAATKSYGTRHESRAYIGLVAKFGKVSLAGIEGIELDPEPYDVWFVHDKGFLQLQAVF
jgi:hypothetical protein